MKILQIPTVQDPPLATPVDEVGQHVSSSRSLPQLFSADDSYPEEASLPLGDYVPHNLYVYTQAFDGAVAGLLSQQTSLPTVESAYTPMIQIADAWGRAVDMAWGTSTDPNSFEYNEILLFSNDLFQISNLQGNPASVTPASYALVADALMAILDDGDAYLESIG